jgi:hypothetical protein
MPIVDARLRLLLPFGVERELSLRVFSASVLTRVLDASEDVGSLKPMWPFEPMPRIWMSMPPRARMRFSYS